MCVCERVYLCVCVGGGGGGGVGGYESLQPATFRLLEELLKGQCTQK